MRRRRQRDSIQRCLEFTATAVLVAFLSVAAEAQGSGLAMAIKATYIIKFAGFVVWPDAAFATPSSPLVICVAGGDPFGSLLDQAASGQSMGAHPFEIRRIAGAGPVAGCHVLFAGDSGIGALEAAAHAPILTITDAPPHAARAGIINFMVQENHVRFEIDDRTARAAGLKISSQLLALAVSIR